MVTKTDLMGAYYAGLPLYTPAASIMVGPPLFCHLDDSLDAALDQMRTHKIHRLYVREGGPRPWGSWPIRISWVCSTAIAISATGTCDGKRLMRSTSMADRLRLREVMTPGVFAHGENDSLLQVMEGLAAHKFGALLITGTDGAPVGVISKTDLILAYKHRTPAEVRAVTVMTRGSAGL